MIVGVLRLQLSLFESFNLKDKRRVLRSMKDRMRNTFNVSVAEVDHLDSHRSAVIGVTMVANERRFVESSLSKVVEFVRRVGQVTLVDYEIETF